MYSYYRVHKYVVYVIQCGVGVFAYLFQTKILHVTLKATKVSCIMNPTCDVYLSNKHGILRQLMMTPISFLSDNAKRPNLHGLATHPPFSPPSHPRTGPPTHHPRVPSLECY